MPAGCNDIYVTVRYYGIGQERPSSKYVTFKDGVITTITLKGCIGAEGCPAIYLE